MKTLIYASYCLLLISLSACYSHDVAKQNGLENLDTLLVLQHSPSVRDVSKYLSQFNDWKDYNHDTNSGGMWIYHNKSASDRCILTVSKGWRTSSPYSSDFVTTQDSFFRLHVLFKDHLLRANYLYQLIKDSSFILRDTTDLYSGRIRSYVRRGVYIEVGSGPNGYGYIDIHNEGDLRNIRTDPMFLTSQIIFEP